MTSALEEGELLLEGSGDKGRGIRKWSCRRHLRMGLLGDVDDEGDQEAKGDHPRFD